MRPPNDSHKGHGGGVAKKTRDDRGEELTGLEEQVLRMRFDGRVAGGHTLAHKAGANAALLRQLHALEVQLRRAARAAPKRAAAARLPPRA